MLNLEVQSLEATISQQQNQIEILTAQIKEQIAQIQKVNARLETNKPAAKIIVNKPKPRMDTMTRMSREALWSAALLRRFRVTTNSGVTCSLLARFVFMEC